jgi:predicted NBD/HSP70 family sugar kinase
MVQTYQRQLVKMMKQANPTKLLAIDIGGTTVKYGLWSDDQISHKNSFKTPNDLDAMYRQLRLAKNEIAELEPEISGVAISVPGSVNTEEGIISGTTAIEYLNHFPLKAGLENIFKLPVSMQNDANCAALAESWRGNAKDADSAIFMIIGTGIGGAMTANGQLVSGKNNFAGEIGYTIAGKENLTISELGSPVKMAERYNRLSDNIKILNGKEIFDQAEAGEPLAKECTNTMYHWLSQTAYNLIVSFNPEKLIIGEGISARPSFIEELNQRVNKLMRIHQVSATVEITNCKYRNDANMIGAVYQYQSEKM